MSEPLRLRVNNEIPAYRPGLVAALDVGSSKIACVIGRAEQGSLKILGSALRESAGVRAGTITSLELAEESIRDCVAAAENHADARIQNVLISVSCGAPVSVTARTVRALVADILAQEFVQALRAKGRSEWGVFKHVVTNAAPTALAVMGLQLGYLLGGSILIETVFAWPGTGFLLNAAIFQRDLPLLQGTILVLAMFFVALNLIVDILQTALDPRIQRS